MTGYDEALVSLRRLVADARSDSLERHLSALRHYGVVAAESGPVDDWWDTARSILTFATDTARDLLGELERIGEAFDWVEKLVPDP